MFEPAWVQENIMPAINPLISSRNVSRSGKVFLLPVYRKAIQSISLALPSCWLSTLLCTNGFSSR